MRTLAVLLLIAIPGAVAAPVPKELRTPPIVGAWEITTSNVWNGGPSTQYNGQRWCFAESGKFTISEPGQAPRLTGSYTLTADGLNILFGQAGLPCKSLHECKGETMQLANTKKNEERPGNLIPNDNTVIYTFKRVKE